MAYVFIVLQCASFWIWCSRVEDYAPDSSTYQGLAESIRLHGTYRFNFAPHIQYPPGLPLFLVAIGALFGTDHPTYLHSIAITSAMALYVGHAFLRSEQDDVAATVGTLLLGASTYYLIYSTTVLNSDVPYLLTSIGALLASRRLDGSGPGVERPAWSVLFGVLLVSSVLLRSAGIALVGGYVLWLVLSGIERRTLDRRRLTTIGIPVALAVATQVAWWSYVDRVRPEALEAWGAGAYTDALRLVDPHQPALGTATVFDLLARIPRNVVQHSAHFVEMLGIDWVDQRWYSPLVVLPLLVIVVGLITTLRRRRGPMECYFVAYAVVYALWPYDVGARFVLPVFPIAFVYAWRGVALLLHRCAAPTLRDAAIVLAGAAMLCVASWVARTTSAAPLSTQARAAFGFWLFVSVLATVWFVARRQPGTVSRLQVGSARRLAIARWTTGLLVALLVARGVSAQVRWGITNANSTVDYTSHRPSVEAARWIANNTGPTDVVMAEQFQVVHYLSGRRIVPFTATTDAARLTALIDRKRVGYLVVVSSVGGSNVLPREADRLAALQADWGNRIHDVFDGHEVRIFRLDRGSGHEP